MPVPKSMQDKYSTVVAAQTDRLKKRGLSAQEASRRAKKIADRWASDHKKGSG